MVDFDQRESPDSVAADFRASGGIEELKSRVDRYSKAKSTALDVGDSILAGFDSPDLTIEEADEHEKLFLRILQCGNYLRFRHYVNHDKVQLHDARFCGRHMLCPLCAIRRGAKALRSYLNRWEAIHADNSSLMPFLVTLTVKNGPDLAERFDHLHKSQRELWKRKQRGRGSFLDGVSGAVWSYEATKNEKTGEWHPHLHMIALAENQPDKYQLSSEWLNITGDSKIVDVRPVSQADPVSGFVEVFKYAVKFSSLDADDTWHAFQQLRGRRLLGNAGLFRGTIVPESLLDDPLDGPFLEYLYGYSKGRYSLLKMTEGNAATNGTPS